MATSSYESALELAETLSPEEQVRLILELSARASRSHPPSKPASVLDLCGLGEEIWQKMDAQEYVERERSSWPG